MFLLVVLTRYAHHMINLARRFKAGFSLGSRCWLACLPRSGIPNITRSYRESVRGYGKSGLRQTGSNNVPSDFSQMVTNLLYCFGRKKKMGALCRQMPANRPYAAKLMHRGI